MKKQMVYVKLLVLSLVFIGFGISSFIYDPLVVNAANPCPSSGYYCGNDGLAANSNTLYYCSAKGAAPQVSQVCSYGCKINPTGVADQCNPPPSGPCPGSGDYCGGTVGQNSNNLYYCSGTGANPTLKQTCSVNGCQYNPSGTADVCKPSGACPGTGDYCGGTVGQNSNNLYYCSSSGANPSLKQTCSVNGCQYNSAGTADVCKPSGACPGSGNYCGSSVGQSANNLYSCSSSGANPSLISSCSYGCQVNPVGTADICKPAPSGACPGSGDYCGGTVGQDSNSLYYCTGSGANPTLKSACSYGCQTNPTGTADVCKPQPVAIQKTICSSSPLDQVNHYCSPCPADKAGDMNCLGVISSTQMNTVFSSFLKYMYKYKDDIYFRSGFGGSGAEKADTPWYLGRYSWWDGKFTDVSSDDLYFIFNGVEYKHHEINYVAQGWISADWDQSPTTLHNLMIAWKAQYIKTVTANAYTAANYGYNTYKNDTNLCQYEGNNPIVFLNSRDCKAVEGKVGYNSATSKIGTPSDFYKRISSVKVNPGWSVRVFNENNLSRCLSHSMWNLSVDYYGDQGNSSVNMEDSITAFQIYNDSICGGTTSGTPPVTSCSTNQFLAQYFNNTGLSGTPVFSRCENSINNDWGGGGPGNGVSVDNFSGRWSGTFSFNAGNYTFTTSADDGVRLYIDNNLVIDNWVDQGTTSKSVTVNLSAGNHIIREEYYEHGGGAVNKLTWTTNSVATPCSTPGNNTFCVNYFNNRYLIGSPSYTTSETTINHDWGSGGPGNGIGNDNFSGRWLGAFNFNAGSYTFTTSADDGVRLYIDNNLVIDNWVDQGTTSKSVNLNLTSGTHLIKMEYYENGGGAVNRLTWTAINSVADPCSTPGSNTFCVTYFNNRYLTGSPTYTTTETSINHDWGSGGPGNGVAVDNFSGRWNGNFYFSAGNHTFTTSADDGVRLYVDNNLVIDNWVDQGTTSKSVTLNLSSGTHTIKMEYYENGGGAVNRLTWTSINSVADPCSTPGSNTFCVTYFNNRYLTGSPTYTTTETSINHDWGSGGPGNGVNVDNFSGRWNGNFNFSAGNHTFTTSADDGVRLYVDNNLVIDNWVDQGTTSKSVTLYLSSGTHTIKMEYYENGGGAVNRLVWN